MVNFNEKCFRPLILWSSVFSKLTIRKNDQLSRYTFTCTNVSVATVCHFAWNFEHLFWAHFPLQAKVLVRRDYRYKKYAAWGTKMIGEYTST